MPSYDPSAAKSGSIFTDNPNYAIPWICYINGIEVPIKAFSLNYGVWQIPEFIIHLLPDVLLIRLGHEDRVPVQIFYLDHWVDPTKPTFRLLVDGEIIGWRYSSYAGERTLSFKCIAHIHLFKQLFFYYMTNVDDIVAAQSPDTQSSGFTQAGLLYPYSLFHQGLLVSPGTGRQTSTGTGRDARRTLDVEGTDDPNTNADAPIQVPYQFVYNVIKGIISTTIPTNRRSLPMLNFFARHTRKTRFHNRWVRLPIFEDPDAVLNQTGVFPIFKAARATEALNAMQRQMSTQIGNNGPVWNTIEMVLRHVYMEIAMIPNPACFRVQLNSSVDDIEQDGKILGLLTDQTPINVQLDTRTRVQVAQELAGQLIDLIEGRGDTANQAHILRNAGLTELPRRVSDVNVETIATNIANLESRNLGVYAQQPLRLAQYFVKPEFMFGIPPHCNVIFPSMMGGWSLDESYINQPTRLYVNDSVMTQLLRATGPNREFMLHALSVGYPEEANAVLHHKVGSSAQGESTSPGAGRESGKNLLIWPTEAYQGIITAKMDIPAWFQMLQQFSNSRPNEDTPAPPTVPAGALNGDINPTTNVTIIPGSGSPRTVTDINYATGTNPVSGGAGTRQQGNNEIFQSGQTVARRIVAVDRTTVVSINGNPNYRFWVLKGGGLDPRFYRDPVKTLLYPFERRRVVIRNIRGRRQQVTEGGDTSGLNTFQKMALMVKFIYPFVQERISGLTEVQAITFTFGVCWIILNEGGVNNVMYNWGFGNQKAYNTFQRTIWSINPGDNLPYIGGETPEEGARNFVERMLSLYARHLAVLLGNSRGNAELQAFLNANVPATNTQYWRLNGGGLRPDYFYISLGYGGYYATESDGRHLNENNQLRRAQIGLSRTRRITQYFDEVRQYLSTVTPRPTTLPVAHRPFISREDYDFVIAQNRTATVYQSGITAATIRTITRTTGVSVGVTPLPNTSTANPAPTTTVPSPTINNSSSDPAELTDNSNNTFSDLFKLYAQYEFLKKKYMERQTAIMMRFNPYLVPGFPMVLFDAAATSMHTVGYIYSISHEGNARGQLGTTVTSVANRTFYEFLNDVRVDIERFSSRIIAAPAEIIESIRNVIQNEEQAELFYQRLFYGGARQPALPAAFNFLNAVGYSRGIDVEEIEIDGEPLTEVNEPTSNPTTSTANNGTTVPEGERTVSHNLDPNLELSVKNNIYGDAFVNYHIAMQMCSRPVCSLEEYIRFWHGGRTLQDLITTGDVAEIRSDFSYDKQKVEDVIRTESDEVTNTPQYTRGVVQRDSAQFYGRIFKLRPGPGRIPTEQEQGFTSGLENISPVVPNSGFPSDYPETRADWDTVLIAYANKVRLLLRPSR